MSTPAQKRFGTVEGERCTIYVVGEREDGGLCLQYCSKKRGSS